MLAELLHCWFVVAFTQLGSIPPHPNQSRGNFAMSHVPRPVHRHVPDKPAGDSWWRATGTQALLAVAIVALCLTAATVCGFLPIATCPMRTAFCRPLLLESIPTMARLIHDYSDTA
jgi:hypothetical protein